MVTAPADTRSRSDSPDKPRSGSQAMILGASVDARSLLRVPTGKRCCCSWVPHLFTLAAGVSRRLTARSGHASLQNCSRGQPRLSMHTMSCPSAIGIGSVVAYRTRPHRRCLGQFSMHGRSTRTCSCVADVAEVFGCGR